MTLPQPVTIQEGFQILDEQARSRLGISGREFLERWDRGFYDGWECDPVVVKVAMLIPLAR